MKRELKLWWAALAELKAPLFRKLEHEEEFDFYAEWQWDVIDFGEVLYPMMWNLSR